MQLHIKNFRSIKQLDLELAPITILYGHNGTGKSSALYAPLTMKNIVLNPNQHLQGFFNYGFTSLGSFEEVIFDHNLNNELELGISIRTTSPNSEGYVVLDYRISCLGDNSGSFQFKVDGLQSETDEVSLPASFPYRRRGQSQIIDNMSETFSVWDGIEASGSSPLSAIAREELQKFANRQVINHLSNEMMNSPAEELRKVSFVPLGRGFFQPMYSLGHERNGSSIMSVEQEVTNLLANDRHLEYAVSHRMEQILHREFRVRGQIGTRDFWLDSRDRKARVSASLVNEGFGVNQLVYMLTKVLHSESGIVCIEEPEIHLHPTAIRRLARALANIVQEERSKRLIISTHSEQFVMSLLALVAEGAHSPDDLAIYLVTKDGKESKFQRQQVNKNGQIEGGLASFMEGELEDMKAFLGV